MELYRGWRFSDKSNASVVFSTVARSSYMSSMYTSGNVIEPYATITINTITIEIFWGISNENILEIFGILFLKKYNPKIMTLENISNPASGPVSYGSISYDSNPNMSKPFDTTVTEINAGNTTDTKLISVMINVVRKTIQEILE